MNNITKIINIMESVGYPITLTELVDKVSRKYHITNDTHLVYAIKHSLGENLYLFCQNEMTSLWGLKPKENYLYVADNKRFQKIRDAMLYVFSKRVNSGSAYFIVDELHAAWFPQFKNADWENTLSEDQKFWFERPKDNADYEADNRLRYVFAHEKEGYRFTGLFKYVETRPDKTRIYELIDDKVLLVKTETPMLICRTTWMKEYRGITEEDKPIGGGSYVDENNDAFEKYNFLPQPDGLIHGFVETKYSKGHTADAQYANTIHIENIDVSARKKDRLENVRVVFVSLNPNVGKTVIVGWYDNATVYRNRFEYNGFYTTMTCKPEEAHLIPVDKREFEVPKASKENKYGIGQSNLWYIQTFSTAKDFENKINAYLDAMI